MKFRSLSLLLLLAVMGVFVVSASADDKADKNVHEGLFLAAEDGGFRMSDVDGKEHSHKLAADAVCVGSDGKECKITDFKKGEKIRVTTKEGDPTIAIKVECLKKKDA
jgi:hypothetical protein